MCFIFRHYNLRIIILRFSDLSPISQMAKEAGLNYFEFSGRRLIDMAQIWNIIKLIKKHQVHILHCHDPKTDFFGMLLKLLFPKLILITTMHGLFKTTKKSAFYIVVDFCALKMFHNVITVSKKLEQTVKKYGISRTHLIHNAIDAEEWQPIYPPDPDLFTPKDPNSFIIGYSGRISKEKGPLDFVRVAHIVLQNNNHCEFVVAGEGPLTESMQDLARKLGIIQKFHFLGQVKSSRMYSLYQKLDLLLSTSHTEGFPNNILEASAMFVPVVATKVGGVGEVIENGYNGFLSDKGDVHSLAQQVLTLKRNQELAEQFRCRGREVVTKRFSFSERAHRLEEVYEELTQ